MQAGYATSPPHVALFNAAAPVGACVRTCVCLRRRACLCSALLCSFFFSLPAKSQPTHPPTHRRTQHFTRISLPTYLSRVPCLPPRQSGTTTYLPTFSKPPPPTLQRNHPPPSLAGFALFQPQPSRKSIIVAPRLHRSPSFLATYCDRLRDQALFAARIPPPFFLEPHSRLRPSFALLPDCCITTPCSASTGQEHDPLRHLHRRLRPRFSPLNHEQTCRRHMASLT